MANTLSVMTNVLRNVVSKQRIRYTENGFNLDLAYIRENIIAMGYPAENLESIYRNRIDDVYKFLEEKYGNHYKIYNLCLERSYDIKKFHGRVAVYPFEDHNPPTIELIQEFCKDMDNWLKADNLNVSAVHCKAGKGRTGTMICCYLLYSGQYTTAEAALAFYDEKRTKDRKGVTIPSQRRYVQYFSKLIQSGVAYKRRILQLYEIRFIEANVLCNQGTLCCSISELQDTLSALKVQPIIALAIDLRKTLNVELKTSSLYLAGDIKVELTHKTSRKKILHFWFNTFFVAETSAVEGEGENAKLVYTLDKYEIDDAHKDKEHKLFSENFKIQLVFCADNWSGQAGSTISSEVNNFKTRRGQHAASNIDILPRSTNNDETDNMMSSMSSCYAETKQKKSKQQEDNFRDFFSAAAAATNAANNCSKENIRESKSETSFSASSTFFGSELEETSDLLQKTTNQQNHSAAAIVKAGLNKSQSDNAKSYGYSFSMKGIHKKQCKPSAFMATKVITETNVNEAYNFIGVSKNTNVSYKNKSSRRANSCMTLPAAAIASDNENTCNCCEICERSHTHNSSARNSNTNCLTPAMHSPYHYYSGNVKKSSNSTAAAAAAEATLCANIDKQDYCYVDCPPVPLAKQQQQQQYADILPINEQLPEESSYVLNSSSTARHRLLHLLLASRTIANPHKSLLRRKCAELPSAVGVAGANHRVQLAHGMHVTPSGSSSSTEAACGASAAPSANNKKLKTKLSKNKQRLFKNFQWFHNHFRKYPGEFCENFMQQTKTMRRSMNGAAGIQQIQFTISASAPLLEQNAAYSPSTYDPNKNKTQLYNSETTSTTSKSKKVAAADSCYNCNSSICSSQLSCTAALAHRTVSNSMQQAENGNTQKRSSCQNCCSCPTKQANAAQTLHAIEFDAAADNNEPVPQKSAAGKAMLNKYIENNSNNTLDKFYSAECQRKANSDVLASAFNCLHIGDEICQLDNVSNSSDPLQTGQRYNAVFNMLHRKNSAELGTASRKANNFSSSSNMSPTRLSSGQYILEENNKLLKDACSIKANNRQQQQQHFVEEDRLKMVRQFSVLPNMYRNLDAAQNVPNSAAAERIDAAATLSAKHSSSDN